MTSSAAPSERQADPVWTFGDRLRKARLSYGATQRDFADELGAKHATYAAWEADRTSCPRETAVARRIEVLTGIRAVWVLGLDDSPPPGTGGPVTSGNGGSLRTGRERATVDGVVLRPVFGGVAPSRSAPELQPAAEAPGASLLVAS